MIFRLIFDDKTEFVQAKNWLDLFQSYEREYEGFHDITEAVEISEEEAKTIMLKNTDYDETDKNENEYFSVFDTVVGDDFCIVGSTDFV